MGSGAAAEPEAGSPGQEWEPVSAGLAATGRGVGRREAELCQLDVRGAAVEPDDWQPAAGERMPTADRGEELALFALPAGRWASSSRWAAER